MKNKNTESKIESKIQNVIDNYKSILFLDKYIINISREKCSDPDSLAETKCNYPYLNVTLFYNEEKLNKLSKKDFELVFIHELCHILTDELYTLANNRHVTSDNLRDANEHLTDTLANIIQSLS